MDYDFEANSANGPAPPERATGKYSWSTVLQGLCLVLVIAVSVSGMIALIATVSSPENAQSEEPRYVILMIPDGFGPAPLTLGRELHPERKLHLDQILLGGARTYSSNSLVTDSAAGATAYASLQKTYNGAIGVDDDQLPIGTLFEAAKAKGYMTGTVVTCRVTHATPAAFTAHVPDRDLEDEIATWQAKRQNVDFIFGGGEKHFNPDDRADGEDLKQHLVDRGYLLLEDRKGFDEWAEDPTFPTVGLFAKDHMEYNVDRVEFSDQPSLAQMVSAVLKGLSKMVDGPRRQRRSFMIMIEGSRIDHGEHDNDPVAAGYDVLAYDEAVKEVLDFQAKHPENTLVISIADHETGGMTLGREHKYEWHPQFIKDAKASSIRLAYRLMQNTASQINPLVKEYWNFELTPEELGQAEALHEEGQQNDPLKVHALSLVLSTFMSARARIGWTTLAHTGVDVQVYARGPESIVKHLRGIQQNTNIGVTIAKFLDLDVDAETKRLRAEAEKGLHFALSKSSARRQSQRVREEEPWHYFSHEAAEI